MTQEDAPNFRHYDERRCHDCLFFSPEERICKRYEIDLNNSAYKVCDSWKSAYNRHGMDLRDVREKK